MRKVWILACAVGLIVSCTNVEEKASVRLAQARAAYEAGDYDEAKLQIDSIKILYPKAYNTRRKGIYLMQDVELAEQERTLAYLDSVRSKRREELDALKSNFVLEKDTAYQRIGNYLAPAQVIERNLHRSYLRFQTDEMGKMSMTSIYCGGNNIHHTSIKVTAPDGSFAETPVSRDSYETADLGEQIEKADYKLGEDGGVISFVAANKDKNLRVDYRGDRTFTTNMMPADRRAAADVYTFSRLLSSLTDIQKEMDEVQVKIRFVQKKIAERSDKVSE